MAETSNKTELFGFKELDKFFQDLRTADQRRIFLDSFRMASKPLIATTKAAVKSRRKTRPGNNNLFKSIGFVPLRSRGKTTFFSAKIGARRFGRYKGYHGHMFDAGTVKRKTDKGYNRGKMKPTHFFTDSVASHEKQLMNDSSGMILQALEKFIARKLKRVNR